jgi:alpha-L-fucosidase
MPNGKIQPEAVQRLQEMGQWLSTYGDSIYGTRNGPISPRSWGVSTRKGNRVFVHVLDWQDESILLPRLNFSVIRAYLMQSREPVKVVPSDYGTVLRLPSIDRTVPDTIIVLETTEH